MNLNKYYRQAALIPSLLIIAGFILFTIYDLFIGAGKDYKSEWLNADSVDIYVVGLIIIHCVFVCLLCCTIFFNRSPKVRASPILSGLSWFALPMLYLCYLLYVLVRSIYFGIDVEATCLFILALTLPYLFSLVFTYIRFRTTIVSHPNRKAPNPTTTH
ncbi:hypothetical protein [Puia dinghuensis]|uniref:Uncharacterized protein n=1 Tax=Puia dinghuensis TaxID=1792502 RepID=A0A8J2XSD7_9BACT|nr:hypothetical protein [Puia dinghuensis]GGA94438.1 hypothetical protein GCM10011511_17160 [Puia dinghuensis]